MNIISYLQERSIVDIFLTTGNTKLAMIDGCDGYFRRDLNKSQVAQLIAELQALHNQMIEEE